MAEHFSTVQGFLGGGDCAPQDAFDGEVAARLLAALADEAPSSRASRQRVGRTCLVLLVLAESGLATREQLERALVMARLPITTAEAFAARSGRFMDDYPVHLPVVEYVEE